MIITKEALNYVFEITKYLYFNLELNEEIEIAKLTKPKNKEMFEAAIDFIIDRSLTLLGGFQIRYTDQTRKSITKVPHWLTVKPEGYTDEHHVMPFKFKKTDEGDPLVVSEKYIKLFEYGEQKKQGNIIVNI